MANFAESGAPAPPIHGVFVKSISYVHIPIVYALRTYSYVALDEFRHGHDPNVPKIMAAPFG